MVVDLDVHQGDGTADCLSREPDLFNSRSIAAELPVAEDPGRSGYRPAGWARRRRIFSVLDARMPPLLDAFQPDIVFYNAGVDPHRDDRLGG